jgi:hypothetical protein
MNKKETLKEMDNCIERGDINNSSNLYFQKAIAIGIKYLVENTKEIERLK